MKAMDYLPRKMQRTPPCNMHTFTCIFRVFVEPLRSIPCFMIIHNVLEQQGFTKVNKMYTHLLGARDMTEGRSSSPMLPLHCCVALGWSYSLPEPQFPHL